MRFACLILVLLVIAPSCHAEESSHYKFDDLKFSIKCPPGYEPEKSENTVSIVLSRPADKQEFRPIVTLSSTPNTNPPIGLEAFFNLVLQNFLKDSNFSIVLAEKTKLGNRDVYQLVYRRKAALKDKHDNVISTKVLQVYITNESRVYVMNYSAAEGDFDGYLAAANEVFKTFRTL